MEFERTACNAGFNEIHFLPNWLTNSQFWLNNPIFIASCSSMDAHRETC